MPVSPGTREAKLKAAQAHRSQRVQILGNISPTVKAHLDAMMEERVKTLWMDKGGTVIDPMAQTLAMLEKGFADLSLRTPQARVLKALVPDDHTSQPIDWPVINREYLDVWAGYTGTSGTVTRALNGVRAGSSSTKPQKGLLERGLVEAMVIDIEGRMETNYQITITGIAAYQAYIAAHGELPKVKDAAKTTNRRRK